MSSSVGISSSRGSGGSAGAAGFANPAVTALAMNTRNITSTGGNSVWTVFAADGWAGVVAACAAIEAAGGNGEVIVYPGTYTATAQCNITSRISNVRIRGFGKATKIIHNGLFDGYVFNFDPGAYLSAGKAVNNITAEDATITFTTASDGGLILAGDFFTVIGTDAQGISDILVCEALSNGSAITGVVTLKGKALKSLTSCTIQNTIQSRNSFNNRITDLWFELGATPPGVAVSGAVHMGYQKSSSLERLVAVGFRNDNNPDATGAVYRMFDSIDFSMKECELDGAGSNGVLFSSSARSKIEDCVFQNTSFNGAASSSGVRITGSFDTTLEGTKLIDCRSHGINFSNGPVRRTTIDKCQIAGSYGFGIDTTNSREIKIGQNSFTSNRKGTGFQAGIYAPSTGGSVGVIIDGNFFEDNEYDIYGEGCDNIIIKGNLHLNPVNIAIALTAGSDRCTVVGNICKNITGGNYGILLSDVDNCVVSGNVIDTANAYGIYVDNSDQNLINSNQIFGATTDAIRLTASTDDNLVNGNIAFGQTITDAGTNNTLANNKVS